MHYRQGDQIEYEDSYEIKDKKLPREQPTNSSIEFQNIVMRYRLGLSYVLKGLSLSIHGGEKIGIVERCMIGSNSLVNSLLNFPSILGPAGFLTHLKGPLFLSL